DERAGDRSELRRRRRGMGGRQTEPHPVDHTGDAPLAVAGDAPARADGASSLSGCVLGRHPQLHRAGGVDLGNDAPRRSDAVDGFSGDVADQYVGGICTGAPAATLSSGWVRTDAWHSKIILGPGTLDELQ